MKGIATNDVGIYKDGSPKVGQLVPHYSNEENLASTTLESNVVI